MNAKIFVLYISYTKLLKIQDSLFFIPKGVQVQHVVKCVLKTAMELQLQWIQELKLCNKNKTIDSESHV